MIQIGNNYQNAFSFNNEKINNNNILDLPFDILTVIIFYLKWQDVGSISLSCKLFRNLTNKDSFWRLYLQNLRNSNHLLSLSINRLNDSMMGKNGLNYWLDCAKVEFIAERLFEGKITRKSYIHNDIDNLGSDFDRDCDIFAQGVFDESIFNYPEFSTYVVGKIFDVKTHEIIVELKEKKSYSIFKQIHNCKIDRKNNLLIATGHPPEILQFWDLKTGSLSKEIPLSNPIIPIDLDEDLKLCICQNNIIDYDGKNHVTLGLNQKIDKYDKINKYIICCENNAKQISQFHIFKLNFLDDVNLSKVLSIEDCKIAYYDENTQVIVGISSDSNKIEIRDIKTGYSQTNYRSNLVKDVADHVSSMYYDSESQLIFLSIIRRVEGSHPKSFIEIYDGNHLNLINLIETIFIPKTPTTYFSVSQLIYDHKKKLLMGSSHGGCMTFWSVETGKLLHSFLSEHKGIKNFTWDKKGTVYIEHKGNYNNQNLYGFSTLKID